MITLLVTTALRLAALVMTAIFVIPKQYNQIKVHDRLINLRRMLFLFTIIVAATIVLPMVNNIFTSLQTLSSTNQFNMIGNALGDFVTALVLKIIYQMKFSKRIKS